VCSTHTASAAAAGPGSTTCFFDHPFDFRQQRGGLNWFRTRRDRVKKKGFVVDE
jgi:hypothetical protein